MKENEIEFPVRFKLKIHIKGEDTKIYKSRDVKFIHDIIKQYKKQYSKSNVEFKIASSNVNRCLNPVFKKFSNIPEAWDNYIYGTNSMGEYYIMNIEDSRVIKLKSVKTLV